MGYRMVNGEWQWYQDVGNQPIDPLDPFAGPLVGYAGAGVGAVPQQVQPQQYPKPEIKIWAENTPVGGAGGVGGGIWTPQQEAMLNEGLDPFAGDYLKIAQDKARAAMEDSIWMKTLQGRELDMKEKQFLASLAQSQNEAEATRQWQQQQLGFQQSESQAEQAYRQQQLTENARQFGLTQQQQQSELEAQKAWQQQQLEADKQARLATLAASPKSWLEYAAQANQAPAIQPWMLPLMSSDYYTSAGEQIPGWQQGDMRSMPALTTPSTQYTARMGPTAQQQYLGYQQAQQGATPEETQFRLWSQAPSSGKWGGLAVRR